MKHNHAPNFGRRVEGCERCAQLAAGAPPKATPVWVERAKRNQMYAAQRTAAIKAHDCKKSGCSVVCTAFDW
jgi:hypothetical protein